MARFWSLVIEHANAYYHIVQSAPLTNETRAKFPELQIGKLVVKADDSYDFVGKIPEVMLMKIDRRMLSAKLT